MSNDQKKAQSTLHRFRETQQAEMGMNRGPSDRRPRMTSNVSSIRDCEKWRGEILREISRKVSKIQDPGMGDYEVRDLNDEINNLMREKSHWERQIISLGGANYRRGKTAMLDDDGREVPGTRGYKYFGRAKDLPGVKELFTRGTVEETEESARTTSFKKFQKQGPAYFGDIDEQDASLLEAEAEEEETEWRKATEHLAELMEVDVGELPEPPKPSTSKTPLQSNSSTSASASAQSKTKGSKKAKRKAEDVEMADGQADEGAKKSKADNEADVDAAAPEVSEEAKAAAASFMSLFDPASLVAPVLPSPQEMADVLLGLRKKALMEEYGVADGE